MTMANTVDERLNEILSLISELARDHDIDLDDRMAAMEQIEDHTNEKHVWLEEQVGEDEENEG
jgi:glutaminase